MIKYFEKHSTIFPVILISSLFITFLIFPVHTVTISKLMLVISMGMGIVFIIQSNQHAYISAEFTREKMNRIIAFDLIGLFLVSLTAIFVGRVAGEYIGLLFGFWLGLFAGFAAGFLAALAVRTMWGKLVIARVR